MQEAGRRRGRQGVTGAGEGPVKTLIESGRNGISFLRGASVKD